jgi:menaquinone-dependent protoporphyrinogen oxidase
MAARVLVAYASRCGSTEGVARAVGDVLREKGLEADVVQVSKAARLETYQAAVIGAPIHAGRWMREARSFVEANQGQLRRMPTACFATCMCLAKNPDKHKKQSESWIPGVKKFIEPATTAAFAGALDRSKLPLFWRIVTKLIGAPQGDFRNWGAIRAWASGLPDVLAGSPGAGDE